MSDAVLIAMVTAVAGVVVALVGVWVELIRARKKTATVVAEVTPNGGTSMKDAIGRIEIDVREIRLDQNRHGQRLATVEARLSDHLRLRPIHEES